MKKSVLAASLVVALSGAAHAADLYRKAPPPAPVASWTGFYAGVNLGGGWSNTDIGYGTNDPVTAVFFGAAADLPANGDRIRSSGVLGGVQIGYNYQIQRSWVAGIETSSRASADRDQHHPTAQVSCRLQRVRTSSTSARFAPGSATWQPTLC